MYSGFVKNSIVPFKYNLLCLQSWIINNTGYTERKRFRITASCLNQNMKSYFGLNKVLFFGIIFVLYFFKFSGKSGLREVIFIENSCWQIYRVSVMPESYSDNFTSEI